MKNLKRVLSLTLAVLMIVALAACGGKGAAASPSDESSAPKAEESIVLKLGHQRNEQSVLHQNIVKFCEAVEERSNGSIKFEIYPNSTMGDNTVMLERLAVGDLDMMLAAVTTNLDKRFVMFTYYLASNWDEAYQAFGPESEIMKAMDGVALENGFRFLGTYPQYFGGLGLAVKPSQPNNLSYNEGIKIRVPSNVYFSIVAETLGYLPTPLAYSDAYTSIQTGVVDGILGGGAEGYYSDMRDVLKYYLPTNTHFENQQICISDETWAKLSENQRTILAEEALKMCEERWATAEQSQEEHEQLLAESGVEIIELSDEFYAECEKAVVANTWEALKDDLGEELYQLVLDNFGERFGMV